MAEANLFAPPTEDELMVPPTEEELAGSKLFAAPSQDELMAPPSKEELAIEPTPTPQESVSTAEATLRGTAQGATFNFADELEAAVRSLGPDETYEDALKKVRGRYLAAKEQHPTATTVGELGGLAGSSFIPVVGALQAERLGGAALLGAAQGALSGLGETESIKDVGQAAKDVAIGAGSGAVMGAVAHGAISLVGKTAKAIFGKDVNIPAIQKDVEAARTTQRELTKEADESLRTALQTGDATEWAKTVGIEGSEEEIKKAFEREMKGLATTIEAPGQTGVAKSTKPLEGRAPEEVLDTARKELGPTEFNRRIDEYLNKKADDAIVDETVKKVGGGSPLAKLQLIIKDGYYVAREVANKTGLDMDRVMDNMSRQDNLYKGDLLATATKVGQFNKEAEKLGIDKDVLYKALDTGDTKGLTPEQLPLYKKMTEQFEAMRTAANNLGANIAKLENYVPKKRVDLADAIIRVGDKADEVKAGLGEVGERLFNGELDDAAFRELRNKNKDFRDLVMGIENLQGLPVRDNQTFLGLLAEASNASTAGKKMVMDVSAAMKREDTIPDFLLEKDPMKLMMKWGQDTFRAVRMQEGLSQLRTIRNSLAKAGFEDYAKYTDNLIADIAGARKGTVSSWMRDQKTAFQTSLKTSLNKMPEETQGQRWKKQFVSTVAETPELMNTLFNQVYPNFLGLSPRAIVGNLTSPLFMTIPELGGSYGSRKMLRAYGSILRNREGLKQTLLDSGTVGPDYTTDLVDALRQGLIKSKTLQVGEKAIEKWTQASMYLFQKSEELNRATHYLLAKDVAADLMERNPATADFVRRMTPSYRKQIEAAVSAKDAAKVQELTTQYIMSKTQFNYNRITMNEFGRYMGPIFSAFTKWPASVAGQMIESFQGGVKGGVKETARRYIAPIMAANALSILAFDVVGGGSERAKEVETLLTGKTTKDTMRGIAKFTPFGSVSSVISGRAFTPPVIATLRDPALAIVEMDPKKLQMWGINTAKAFVPGAGLYRFATETLPASSDALFGTKYNPYKEK